MRYRALGTTGREVSVIGLGTWQLGGEWGREFTEGDAARIVDAARAGGITLLDTAECYGDHVSERLLGGAIRADRDRWFVATKFGHRYVAPLEREQRWSVPDVRVQLEDSLRALGTGWIDLYQFHSGTNEAFDNDELWRWLGEQKRAGKVRALGVSIANSLGPEVRMHQARRARELGVDCLQVVYNRLERWAEDEILPFARSAGLGVIARVPLASGFLGGRIGAATRFDAGDHRARRSPEEVGRLAADAERVRREEVPPGMPLPAWALAWCLRNPAVTAVIPGARSPEQAAANAAAAELVVDAR